MRIAAAWIALVAAAVAVAGCTVQVPGTAVPDAASAPGPAAPSQSSAPAQAPPEGAFVDALGRFALVPPAGWTVDTSGAQGTSVVFLDPLPSTSIAGRFSANINVIVVPSGAELEATVVGARQELQGLTDYVQTSDESVTLTDGTPAHLLGGSFTDQATGLALRNVQLFTVYEGATLVATGTSLQDVWGAYEQTLQTSLRSLTVVI